MGSAQGSNVEGLKEARAWERIFSSKVWRAKEEMMGGLLIVEAKGARLVTYSGSPTDDCLLEEASKYSSLPNSFCALGGQDSSSSSRLERVMIAVGGSRCCC